jgi:AraC-like DNA-binding protein
MLIERWYSRNIDESVARLDRTFQGVRGFAAHGGASKFWNAHVRLALGDVTLTRFAGAGVRFAASFGDVLHVGIPMNAGARVESRKGTICTSPFVLGNTLPPSESFAMDVLPGVTFAADIPLATAVRQAQKLVEDVTVADTIAVGIDLREGPGAALARNIPTLFNELQALSEVGLGPLAVAGFSEVLLNLVLAATLPKLRAKLSDPPSEIAPLAYERARQYLHEHAHEPIRIADLATELGVSVRALQAGFRRRLGCSPRQYLLNCRLALAQTRLLSAAPTETVSSIAVDCGFLNLGLFASRYRRTFGELPSHTLRRSRFVRGPGPPR